MRSALTGLAASVCLLTAGFAAGDAAADEATIFAAASLKNALDEISESFESDTGNTLSISYAGSSALARQIQQGAPADVFISANQKWMDTLEEEKLVVPETRYDLLANSIVLIAHGTDAAPVEIGPEMDLDGMLGDGRLAMALVDAVPAGIYGKASLETLGLWDTVSPKVAQADNVRAALALVSTGEAPYGIVYATDAVADDNVSVVGTFPADSHPAIIYPAALVAGSTSGGATELLEYLSGPVARAAFEGQGFTVIPE